MAELPKKTVYKKGEKLDMSGAVLQVKYRNGKVCSATENFSVSGYDPSKVGKQKITVKHGDHKTSFYVTVESEKATLTKLQPIVTKTEYMIGETLDLSTISLKLTLSDGSTKIVKSDFSVSGFSSDSAGKVTVTVSYRELNGKFEVIISEQTPPPTADESQDDISITESEDETDTSPDESQDESIESNDETDTSSDESQDESIESKDETDTSSDESQDESIESKDETDTSLDAPQDESIESKDETDTSLDAPQDESPELPSVSKAESSDDAPAILRGEMQMWVILLVLGLVVLCVIVLIIKRRSQKNKE